MLSLAKETATVAPASTEIAYQLLLMHLDKAEAGDETAKAEVVEAKRRATA